MGKPIIKIRDKYLVWSTVVDGPITYGMTLEELTAFVKEEYGNEGLMDLPSRLERLERTGSSGHYPMDSLADVIACNRAGERETEITLEEIYERYCSENALTRHHEGR